MAYRIKDWATHYENNRTKELKRLEWVPMPNRMDGAGYTRLVNHPEGAAHLGAWLAIVEISSRQATRGTIPQDDAADHGGSSQDAAAACLGRMSQLPAVVFSQVIPRLLKIGWLEELPGDNVRQFKHLQESRTIPQDDAERCLRAREEGKGMEGKGKEHSAPADSPEETAQRMYLRHPKKRDLALLPAALEKAAKIKPLSEIDSCHAAWCEEEDWKKQNGRFAPKLPEWLSDLGFLKWPQSREPPRRLRLYTGPVEPEDPNLPSL